MEWLNTGRKLTCVASMGVLDLGSNGEENSGYNSGGDEGHQKAVQGRQGTQGEGTMMEEESQEAMVEEGEIRER